MKRSETIGKLAEALCKAQAEFSPAAFDRENPYFKSRYATLASVFDAAKPAFRNGLSVTQSIETHDGKVIINTILMHVSGEWIETEISMKPKTDGPQDVGSAGTYGRRYALASILGLSSVEDDDGNQASGNIPQKNERPQPKKELKTPGMPAKAPEKSPEPKPSNEEKEATVAPPIGNKQESIDRPTKKEMTGKELADQLKMIREGAIKLGAKNPDEIRAFVGGLVGREIKSATELTAPEREEVLAAIAADMAQGLSKEAA